MLDGIVPTLLTDTLAHPIIGVWPVDLLDHTYDVLYGKGPSPLSMPAALSMWGTDFVKDLA